MLDANMLTIEQCRKLLKSKELTDQEIEQIRRTLYEVSHEVIGRYFLKKGYHTTTYDKQ